MANRLVAFRGTDEEACLKQSLKRPISADHSSPAGFFNLIIKWSNALLGTAFNDAWVSLKLTEDRLRRNYNEYGKAECGLVKFNSLLNVSILETFIRFGVDNIEKIDLDGRHAFLCILEFLRVPGKVYEVDDKIGPGPIMCGCGCKAEICKGNTALGSCGTWHGRVDIYLNSKIPVVVQTQYMTSQDVEEDDSGDDEHNDEHIMKQRRKENENFDENEEDPILKNGESCDYSAEVKYEYDRNEDTVLMCQTGLQRVLVQAITNGFAQVNRNEISLSQFFIPTFGATSNHVTICLYEPENDILLHIEKQLKLWMDSPNGTSELKVDTIVIIWLFLNFTIFTPNCLHSLMEFKTSGMHKDLGQNLDLYKTTTTKVDYEIPLIPVFDDVDPAVLS
ncbi:uncharacterized protein [Argopecten irradians]|uniref:uncharacterized protein isoform X2 n=1 Tax=Argopecten irradians TaxID=31199 RepID=UPI0037179662